MDVLWCGVWCGAGPLSLFPLSSSLVGVCVGVCVGCWVGWECVCVGLGVLVDVAAPQRGDQVKQVIYDLAKTATNLSLIQHV